MVTCIDNIVLFRKKLEQVQITCSLKEFDQLPQYKKIAKLHSFAFKSKNNVLFFDKISESSGSNHARHLSPELVLWGFAMDVLQDCVAVSDLELMILEEIGIEGKILVRSLDKIHARTGINYSTISRVADKLQRTRHS